MGLIATIVVGLIAGWLASVLMKARTGILMILLLGVGGSIVGGWISTVVFHQNLITGVNLPSILLALIGAVVVIAVYRFFQGRR